MGLYQAKDKGNNKGKKKKSKESSLGIQTDDACWAWATQIKTGFFSEA